MIGEEPLSLLLPSVPPLPPHRLLHGLLIVLQQERADRWRRRCVGWVSGRHCTAVVPPEEMALVGGEQRVELRLLHLSKGRRLLVNTILIVWDGCMRNEVVGRLPVHTYCVGWVHEK